MRGEYNRRDRIRPREPPINYIIIFSSILSRFIRFSKKRFHIIYISVYERFDKNNAGQKLTSTGGRGDAAVPNREQRESRCSRSTSTFIQNFYFLSLIIIIATITVQPTYKLQLLLNMAGWRFNNRSGHLKKKKQNNKTKRPHDDSAQDTSTIILYYAFWGQDRKTRRRVVIVLFIIIINIIRNDEFYDVFLFASAVNRCNKALSPNKDLRPVSIV